MAKDFKLISSYAGGMPMKTLAKASETVIEAGDMVALDAGLAIKGVDASKALAYSPTWAAAGETTVQILNDKDAEFIGTADANFAAADRGTEVDLVLSGGTQEIDLGTSSTDVFKVSVGTDAGTVGAKTNVKVKINKFIY